ncbi:MAG: hypothetical protein HY883_06605, partial [Deltaproteobacteria bacterium]|nr:hypothetical protein [Deltaproteobacteria bacterium]
MQKLLISVIIVILPLLATFLVTYRQNRRHLERLIMRDLTALAETHEGSLYQFIEMSKRRAEDFSSDGFIRDKLEEIISGRKGEGAALINHLLKNKIILDKAVHHIEVAAPDGVVV